MQAFIHLTLFALLFVISATAATSSTSTMITGNTTPVPGSPTPPAGANSTTPAPGSPTPPAGANGTTPAPGSPTPPAGANGTTPAPGSPTPPAGANSTTPPAGANGTTPAPGSPTPPAGANSTTPAPGSPTPPAGVNSTTPPAGANGTTPAPGSPTPPAGANGTTPPAGANGTTPAPGSPTPPAGANSTTPAPGSPTPPAGANSTTPPAGANGTTPAPGSPTPPAGANSTTPAPGPPTPPAGANSTTPPAGANSTTPAPGSLAPPAGANSTTSASASTAAPTGTDNTIPAPATPMTPTTFIKGNSPGTVPSVTSSSVTLPKTSNPNPDTTNLCGHDSCTGGSKCVNLTTTHFCLCIDGYYYKSSSCKKGKVFPGMIQVKTPDTSDLKNESSIDYENLYKEVNKFFKDVFTNSDYGQTVIQQRSISPSARSQLHAGDKIVNVTVVNLFAEDTKENETTISSKINNAISSSSIIADYTNQDRCEFYGCIKENDCSDGFHCKCQPDYERPDPYTAICLPLSQKCPYACKSKTNMQCLTKEDGSPDCVCLAGYKKDDHEKCQACAFGYNGVNCEDNFQLILIVLGTVAGILILGMLIALIFMRSKKTKDIEEQNLIENDFQNLKLQQTTGFNSPAEGSIFPKITAGFPRNGGMQNPYANPRGIPRPDY